MYENFIGDGVCDDDLPGCYNTSICNYDGGDCCEDKCQDGAYTQCGSSGYFCADPTSTKCDPTYIEDDVEVRLSSMNEARSERK